VDVSYAPAAAWATDLVFGAAIAIGDKTYHITNLKAYDDAMHVFKEDSVWKVVTDIPQLLPLGIDVHADVVNGAGVLAKDLFLYFTYGPTIEQYFATTLNDIGPWKGSGLPAGRTGTIGAIDGGIGTLFAAIDGIYSNTSSVLLYNNTGWHEIFRAWAAGERIRNIRYIPQSGTRSRLWVDIGGDMVYLEFPEGTLDPATDYGGLARQHEGYLITGRIEMGTDNLPKYLKRVAMSTDNLGTSIAGYEKFIDVDYQVNEDVGTSTWLYAGRVQKSPLEYADINVGGVYSARLRFRFKTSDGAGDLFPILRAYVLEGYTRTPVQRQFAIRARVSHDAHDKLGGIDANPDDLLDWLNNAAQTAQKIILRSRFKRFDNRLVVVEPVTPIYESMSEKSDRWSGVLAFTVREV